MLQRYRMRAIGRSCAPVVPVQAHVHDGWVSLENVLRAVAVVDVKVQDDDAASASILPEEQPGTGVKQPVESGRWQLELSSRLHHTMLQESAETAGWALTHTFRWGFALKARRQAGTEQRPSPHLRCACRNAGIVKEAEAHRGVALCVVARGPHNRHAAGCLPARHRDRHVSARAG